jgi:hypothetical protein
MVIADESPDLIRVEEVGADGNWPALAPRIHTGEGILRCHTCPLEEYY